MVGNTRWPVGNPQAETRVWATPVVMRHPLGQDSPQMLLVQGDHEIHTLAANRADHRHEAECG